VSNVSDPSFGVLVVAYGAPGSLDDVEPYLLDVRGGRPTPGHVVEELRARYAAIGGRSPLLDHTREQAAALGRRLDEGTSVFVGMRHWRPFIKDVLAEAAAQGVRRVVALAMAPHFSRMSIGAYQKKIEEARGPIEVALVSQWFDHPKFLDAVAGRVRGALDRFPAAQRDQVTVLFTAHSLPERILKEGDPYQAQLAASVAGVMTRLPAQPHEFAFQSAGQTPEPWLGPDAGQALDRLAAAGRRDVLICPIGFVADHLEVLYDVDIEFRRRAVGLGLRLERTESLNADPALIEALADLVLQTARQRGWRA
jgi:protoporphyrin/coproporphyrin ferrochelatase